MRPRIRPFEALDAVRLTVQESQKVQAGRVAETVTLPEAVLLEQSGPAWTCEEADGSIAAVGGFSINFCDEDGNPCHVQLWGIFAPMSVAAKKCMARFMRALIADSPIRRIDAYVHAVRPEEAQWVKLIGLTYNTALHGFGADGGTVELYERVLP